MRPPARPPVLAGKMVIESLYYTAQRRNAHAAWPVLAALLHWPKLAGRTRTCSQGVRVVVRDGRIGACVRAVLKRTGYDAGFGESTYLAVRLVCFLFGQAKV